MWRGKSSPTTNSRGQVLPLAALMMAVLIAAVGLAIDAGRCFIARAELVRAVDAAALAGTLELPDLDAAQAKVVAYMAENEPDASVEAPISPVERQIEVRGTKSVDVIFMRIFGFDTVEVSASATAGFGVLAVDTVMAIDATGSMGDGSGCPSGPTCPIVAAKNAAKRFTDTLLSGSTSSSETLVGATPYRGCFNPTRTYADCVPIATMVQPLSNDKTTVQSKIDDIQAQGGTGTNVCLGMSEANDILHGINHHTVSNMLHIVVILSDGDNTYNANSYSSSQNAPPPQCRPDYDPAHSDTYVDTSCRSAQTRERQLDVKTKALVDAMKADGVEVYVVGFGVCGTKNSYLCNPSLIGGTSHDNTADRNLLKCLASSTPGTNDHYFEASSASDLPGIFTNIARLIGFRLIK
jgi:hypothetical protein